ncbi:MAG: Cytochrome C family protein [Candidatus Methanohalarchaeum thermophilum]|uniref:Cytochrome C family protein n=1 Tax=Methanohalarchaeum thermophilum TaxID=1903181 RepID=A0A1Q6DXL2_METT1|nr:MAG: Cytochrome C family protein [Candidatus Methanohalarchaeum thermophilum]
MSKKEKEDNKVKTSRRGFLAGSTGFAAGLALGSSGLSLLAPTKVSAQNVDESAPYEKLNPEEVKLMAHENYHKGLDCGEGTFKALIELARDKIGEPYTEIPTVLAWYGAGGGVGWSKLCGSANAGAAFISLVHGRSKTTKKLVDEYWRWYSQYPFPQYDPPSDASGLPDLDLPTSVSNSVDCHVSVTTWCQKSKYSSGAPERSERCSRLIADCAARVIELLNAEKDGKFEKVAVSSTPTSVDPDNGCRSCHSKGKDFEIGGFTRGKADCIQCHQAPHLKR